MSKFVPPAAAAPTLISRPQQATLAVRPISGRNFVSLGIDCRRVAASSSSES